MDRPIQVSIPKGCPVRMLRSGLFRLYMILYHNRVPKGWTGQTFLLSFVWITELVCDGSSIGETMYEYTRTDSIREASLL